MKTPEAPQKEKKNFFFLLLFFSIIWNSSKTLCFVCCFSTPFFLLESPQSDGSR
jgi:hypothetical protein